MPTERVRSASFEARRVRPPIVPRYSRTAMTLKKLLLRYAFAVALREWTWCASIRPQIRVGVAAGVGAVIAPFVVFVHPAARLYWLVTGKQLLGRLRFVTPQPYVFVNPFRTSRPDEIRELLERPEYNWEPGPGDIPWWQDAWVRLAQALYWERPRSPKTTLRTTSSS
jgi:hypothetical protein